MDKQLLLIQELKSRVEKAEKSKARSHPGFKAILHVLGKNIPVRYKRINADAVIKEKMAIKAVRRDTGEEVFRRRVAKVVLTDLRGRFIDEGPEFRFEDLDLVVKARTCDVWLTKNGEEVPDGEVAYVQEQDGKLVEVEPWDKTDIIEVSDFIPMSRVDEYFVEKRYWLYADDPSAIAELAEVARYMWENDVAGFCPFFVLRKGFTAYAALIYPLRREDKFVFVMDLTRMKMRFDILMPLEPQVGQKVKAKPVFLFE